MCVERVIPSILYFPHLAPAQVPPNHGVVEVSVLATNSVGFATDAHDADLECGGFLCTTVIGRARTHA